MHEGMVIGQMYLNSGIAAADIIVSLPGMLDVHLFGAVARRAGPQLIRRAQNRPHRLSSFDNSMQMQSRRRRS